MSDGAGQGSAARPVAETNTERHLERIGDLLEQQIALLRGEDAGPATGKGIKVSEPAAGAAQPRPMIQEDRTSPATKPSRRITKG